MPQAQHSVLACVLEAVREHLVHGEHEVFRAIAESGLLRPGLTRAGARRAVRAGVTADLLGLGGAARPAARRSPRRPCRSRSSRANALSVPSYETTGWLRRASAITSSGSAAVSYGQIRRKSSAAAKARLMSDSCSWHSHQLGRDCGRPRWARRCRACRLPAPAWSATNRLHAGMMRAGLRPTTSMSAKCTSCGASAEGVAQQPELPRAHHHERPARRAPGRSSNEGHASGRRTRSSPVVEDGFVMKGRGTGHSGVHNWVIPGCDHER